MVIKPKSERHIELSWIPFAEAKEHHVSAFDKLWIFRRIHQSLPLFPSHRNTLTSINCTKCPFCGIVASLLVISHGTGMRWIHPEIGITPRVLPAVAGSPLRGGLESGVLLHGAFGQPSSPGCDLFSLTLNTIIGEKRILLDNFYFYSHHTAMCAVYTAAKETIWLIYSKNANNLV